MRVGVFGLGYVGSVSAACLADLGHAVIGIDVSAEKAAAVRRGRSPVAEAGLDELLGAAIRDGRLHVTEDPVEAVQKSDVSLICVGTPGYPNGRLDFRHLEAALADVARGLRHTDAYHVVVIRSTIVPGSLEELLKPLLEKTSGKIAGTEFGLCVNPEFLREGTAIADFRSPPFTVIGQGDERSGDLLEELYAGVSAPVFRLGPDEACMVKYACNAFHALKVAFGNEIGVLSGELGVDSHRVMEVFCQDTVLNVSSAYLTPGFAFGGSCLPKDLRALLHAAKRRDVELPVLSAVLPSNERHIRRAVDLVAATGKRKVAMLGLSFKAGTDDLRESPFVLLAETLVGKGFELKIYDEDVSLSRLVGRNLEYITSVLPHIARLLTTDLERTVAESEVLIIAKKQLRHRMPAGLVRADQVAIELARSGEWSPARTAGIAW